MRKLISITPILFMALGVVGCLLGLWSATLGLLFGVLFIYLSVDTLIRSENVAGKRQKALKSIGFLVIGLVAITSAEPQYRSDFLKKLKGIATQNSQQQPISPGERAAQAQTDLEQLEFETFANQRKLSLSKHLKGNKFGVKVSGLEFIKNPIGEGVFIYNPKTRYFGAERFFIWFANNGIVAALNGPSKKATPDLPFPRDAGEELIRDTGHTTYGLTSYGIELFFN